MGYLINKKSGQSLVELASFGTILLLCVSMLIQYGMRANYQQNLKMQAFRKAMQAAYVNSGPASSATLTMLQDKPIPNPHDTWGFAERVPVSAGDSVVWDVNLSALYEYGNPDDLPKSIIEINETAHIFTTAGFDNRACSGSIMVLIENLPKDRLAQSKEYKEMVIACNDIRVMDRSPKMEEGAGTGILRAYFKTPDGLLHSINSADVTGNGQIETILEVEGTQECVDGYCGRLAHIWYLDSKKSDIDAEFTQALPWTKVSPDNQQGLLADYNIQKQYNNQLVKTVKDDGFKTETTVGSTQAVTHYIRLNDGAAATPYTTTFTPEYGQERKSRPEDVDAEYWGWSK